MTPFEAEIRSVDQVVVLLLIVQDSRSLKFSRLETEKISGSESKLLETITSRRQRRHDISTEEMKAVLQDRDAIMAKVSLDVVSGPRLVLGHPVSPWDRKGCLFVGLCMFFIHEFVT